MNDDVMNDGEYLLLRQVIVKGKNTERTVHAVSPNQTKTARAKLNNNDSESIRVSIDSFSLIFAFLCHVC